MGKLYLVLGSSVPWPKALFPGREYCEGLPQDTGEDAREEGQPGDPDGVQRVLQEEAGDEGRQEEGGQGKEAGGNSP